MRVLIIEDNERLAALVMAALARGGFACDWAGTLAEAGNALDVAEYDAVLLDLGLPDGDGLDWLRQRRRGGFAGPVLVLTARGALDDRVIGLDAGADDYLVKPAAIVSTAEQKSAIRRRKTRPRCYMPGGVA